MNNNSYTWNPFGSPEVNNDFDLEFLKREVGQRFPFYDVRSNPNAVAFFCRVDKEILEEKFDSLRLTLSKKGYIPMLRYERGEHIIYILQKPKRKEKPVWVNYLLLILTISMTIITGSILHIGFFDIYAKDLNIMEIFEPVNLFYGAILFSLPLMSILIIHEMGHYFVSKKHGISTSLPFFLPIPPIFPNFNIGTMGALISSRDPMPNKKALFDIGLSGPVAGFLVAIPVTIIGIATSEVVPVSEVASGEPILGSSLLFMIITQNIHTIPTDSVLILSPIAFAGWVGLFITALNLLPAGQLDGGHIFRAVFGEKQKYASWIAVIFLILIGLWLFAFIIIFMLGAKHPPPLDDDTELDIKRKLLFIVALAILVLCFIINPISTAP